MRSAWTVALASLAWCACVPPRVVYVDDLAPGDAMGDAMVDGAPDQVSPPDSGTIVPLLVSAGHANCLRWFDGSARCWGNGVTSAVVRTATLTPISGVVNVQQMSMSSNNLCYIGAGGQPNCLGDNNFGELGPGTMAASSDTPFVVSMTAFRQLAIGTQFVCGLTEHTMPTVQCWGHDDQGQLGDGMPANTQNSPVDLEFDDGVSRMDFVSVAAGDRHACAVLRSGNVFCWGANDRGQLGTDSSGMNVIRVRALADFPEPITAVAAGGNSTFFLSSMRHVFAVGQNDVGQLGLGNSADSMTPARALLVDVVQIVSSGRHSCALLSNRSVECWGANSEGQLGRGTMTPSEDTPAPVVGLQNVLAIGVGVGNPAMGQPPTGHSCALQAISTGYQLVCWGSNEDLQLGYDSGGTPAMQPGNAVPIHP